MGTVKKALFCTALIMIAFYIGWKFGQYWIPKFYYKYMPGSQDPEWVRGVGEWMCSLAAVGLEIVFIKYLAAAYNIVEFFAFLLLLVIIGGALAALTEFFIQIFTICIVGGLFVFLLYKLH